MWRRDGSGGPDSNVHIVLRVEVYDRWPEFSNFSVHAGLSSGIYSLPSILRPRGRQLTLYLTSSQVAQEKHCLGCKGSIADDFT